MAIKPIEFGKNLRSSTVDAIKKINELVTTINGIDASAIGKLSTDVKNLQTTVASHTTSIDNNTKSLDTVKKTQEAHTADIDKIKVTLYTPLSAEDSAE